MSQSYLTAKMNWSITEGDVHVHKWVKALSAAAGCLQKKNEGEKHIQIPKTKNNMSI